MTMSSSRRTSPSAANPKFAIPRGNSASEFRIQSHTSNLLILVWFSNLKFLSADAIVILGTSNSPHGARARAGEFADRVDRKQLARNVGLVRHPGGHDTPPPLAARAPP